MMLKETGKPKSKDKDKQKKVAFATVEEESSDCDEEEEGIDAAWITFADTVAAALSDKSIGPSDVLIDNAATVCIVNNPALLEDITDLEIPRVVSGVGGSMTIYQEGLLPVIGRVLYSPDFMVSVISQSRIVKNRCLDLDYLKAEDKYRVTEILSGVSLNFLPKHGLYVCDFQARKSFPLMTYQP